MSQEKNESLYKGNFDQNVAQANRDKVEERRWRFLARLGPQEQRDNEKREHCQDRNEQKHRQYCYPEIHLPIHSLMRAGMEEPPQFQSEEKKRRIIGHRAHVVVIVGAEMVGIIAHDQLREGIVSLSGRRIENLHRRIAVNVLLYRIFFRHGESRFLGQDGDIDSALSELILRHDDEIT